nr:hypothetical protein [Paenibacillus sacheonensis]
MDGLLTNNQSSAFVSLRTFDESYALPLFGLQIDTILDIDIVKTVNRNEAAPGEQVVYTFRVVNSGTVPLHNLIIEDLLIGLRETVQILDSLQEVVFTLPFTVPLDALGGSVIPNRVDVRTDEISAFATAEITVSSVPGIAINKTADRTVASIGESILYTISVRNTGNITLTNVILIDSLSVLSIPPFTLAVGEERSFTFSTLAQGSIIKNGLIRNIAAVTSNETPEAQDQFTVRIIPSAVGLSLQKSVFPVAARPRETVLYTLLLTNTGDVPVTGIRLSDTALALDAVVGDLNPGESLTLNIPFMVDEDAVPGTQIPNIAVAEGTASGGAVTASDSALLSIIPAPALAIDKRVDQSEISPGQSVTYTISVVNLGDVRLTNVEVTDRLLSLHDIIPVLEVGEIRRFNVTVNVPATAPAGLVVSNIVTATSDQTATTEDTAFFTVVSDLPPSPRLRLHLIWKKRSINRRRNREIRYCIELLLLMIQM